LSLTVLILKDFHIVNLIAKKSLLQGSIEVQRSVLFVFTG